MAKREIAERIDEQLAVEVRTPSHRLAEANGQRDAANGQRRALRSPVLSIGSPHRIQAPRPARAATAGSLADARRRLERDLHDGFQDELVALIIKLALAQQDPETPPALVETLAGLEARAQAALDSARTIARGIVPSAARPVLVEGERSVHPNGVIDVRGSG